MCAMLGSFGSFVTLTAYIFAQVDGQTKFEWVDGWTDGRNGMDGLMDGMALMDGENQEKPRKK